MNNADSLDPALMSELGVEDPELAAAIEASYKSHVPARAAGANQGFPHDEGHAEDTELAAAIEASYKSSAAPRGADAHQAFDQMLARALEESMKEPQRQANAETRGQIPAFLPGGSSSSSMPAAAPSATNGLDFLRTANTRLAPAHARDEVGSDVAERGSSRGGSPHLGPEAEGEVMDPQLAAVIEASYAAQTETARLENEEEMIRQAMEISRKEEERRQNQQLREQQEAELQESILMDQMREQEEKRRRLEEEEQQRASEAAKEAELQRQQQEERQRLEAQQLRAENLPPEPPADAPDKVDLQIRTPDGRRVRRRFVVSNTVGQVYDYLHLEGHLGDEAFQLVSTMPRKEYQDRKQTLSDAGLQGQCALMLERLQ